MTVEAYHKGPLAKFGGEPDAVAKAIEKAIARGTAADPGTRHSLREDAGRAAADDGSRDVGQVPGDTVHAPRSRLNLAGTARRTKLPRSAVRAAPPTSPRRELPGRATRCS